MKNQIRLMAIVAMGACMTAAAFAQSSTESIYKTKCAMCHAADGSGNTPAGKRMNVPPLKSPDIVKKSDAELIAATKNGKGKMKGYANKLTDSQIKELIAYVRTLQKK
ncbi:MAG: c-type cytochrome [Acidobacteriaceae bacterium]